MGRTESIIRRFPDFFQPDGVHSVTYRFVAVFGSMLDEAETALIDVMRAHWVDTAHNEGSKGFNTTQKGDLDKIFSLFLENLGGTSQLKQVDRRSGAAGLIDDAIYRERIKGLIEVLKNGASTKEGIIAIVAANLGIVGDEPEAVAAREQIEIIEFLPRLHASEVYELEVYEAFSLINPNVIDTTPEIRLRIRPDIPVPLINPRVVNTTTGQSVQYVGSVSGGDTLVFFAGGEAFLNGVSIPVVGGVPSLPPGASQWRFEAFIGFSEGRFDTSRFDFSTFEEEALQAVGVFDLDTSRFGEAVFAIEQPAVDLTMTLPKLSPASFMVRVPWDIPGYTEKFDVLPDNPRNQIKYIVDKVKAAGTFAVIAYEKCFTEEQGLADALTVIVPRMEEQGMEEVNFDLGSIQKPYPGGVAHEMADALVTSGVYDFTRFDSLNTFA